MKLPFAVALIAIVASSVQGQEEARLSRGDDTSLSVFPQGYPGHEVLSATIRKLAVDHPETIRLRSLAKTGKGRDILLVSAGAPDGTAPAVLVVANLEADHVIGSVVALKMLEALANQANDDTMTYYIVPRLNADGAETVLSGGPRSSFRLNLSPIDRDRDGKTGEDGPNDLDGDGLATKMRYKTPASTMVRDEKDPRILRKADAAKGERGEVSEAVESLDDDGDGVIGEDPSGGVNLNRNWPYKWTEFDLETGWTPASEPEVRGLIEFAFAHPEIAAIWTFALNDNLKTEPKKPGSLLDDADLPYFAELSREFSRIVKVPEWKPTQEAAPAAEDAPSAPLAPLSETRPRPIVSESPAPVTLDGTTDGAMSEWAYHHFGVIGLSSRLWASPEIPEAEKGKPAVPSEGEARWLFWNDHVMGGRAFVPFHAFEHPELGPVQIGGWKPAVRVNPPIERASAIADAHLAFLKALGKRLPRLKLSDVEVTARGARVFEITARVTNEGYLPTALAQGVKTRSAPPVLVRLQGEGIRMLSGKPLNREASLAGSGGQITYRWLIMAPKGTDSVTIQASCAKAGTVKQRIDLKD